MLFPSKAAFNFGEWAAMTSLCTWKVRLALSLPTMKATILMGVLP
jgi:hypothetical protein